ncbi:MAG TPA: multicopper oxidase family protein [Terracidiphilus sp.]|jgi:FtsP/CotA-like multicopper oxidase with cupredoxin domain
MKPMTKNYAIFATRLLVVAMAAATSLVPTAHAAAPGITGPNFNLIAQTSYLNQPDGSSVYSWGYGCNGTPSGFAPSAIKNTNCPLMQVPGPTMIVTEGQTVTVTLTNGLPTPAGNTSILFPGFQVTAAAASSQTAACTAAYPAAAQQAPPGLLTTEAANGCAVTYTFTASSPGTHSYYSGTQGDLQVEMGLYGALIVLPKNVPASCNSGGAGTSGNLRAANVLVEQAHGESDFRLANAAYDHEKTCYDREYLFQFAEMDPNIHNQALAQVTARNGCAPGSLGCSLEVPTEPYHPTYFMINGRSMPDDMDPNYDTPYPSQPYNGNPHMHPGELVLLRIIGQGRWQHPFHEHANHVRVLARDGNLILSNTDSDALAGAPLFTTTTTPGQTIDGIFYFTGRGLNWDMYGHNGSDALASNANPACVPDSNGYYTANSSPAAPAAAINYYEWCQDHDKPLQVAPFGDVGMGGPVSLPDANILTNGNWFGGSPYLGPDANVRATGPNSVYQPANTQGNPSNERGFAFMWHSHNEREITTNNVFPGGMMMMMLVDSREFVIDEAN